jgi:hypothetical protein
MTTFVLNTTCYGGFTLSDAALKRLGWHRDARYPVLDTDMRSNPELVRVCKELGPRASADGKAFTFVDVASADIPFVTFSDYDGVESLTIDTKAKARTQGKDIGDQAVVIQTIRQVLTCNLSEAEKLRVIASLLK